MGMEDETNDKGELLEEMKRLKSEKEQISEEFDVLMSKFERQENVSARYYIRFRR